MGKRTEINKNLVKAIGSYPIVSGANIEDIGKVVAKEALRKKSKKSKPKNKKKDCGCGA